MFIMYIFINHLFIDVILLVSILCDSNLMSINFLHTFLKGIDKKMSCKITAFFNKKKNNSEINHGII